MNPFSRTSKSSTTLDSHILFIYTLVTSRVLAAMVLSDNSPQIELTTVQADAVRKALQYWSHSKLVSAELVGDLLATVLIVEEEHGFNWNGFAKYTFRLAVICLAIAIISLVFDETVPKIVKRILELPVTMRVPATTALAITVLVWGYQRSLTIPQQFYFNEAIHSLGSLLFGLAALQLGVALKADESKNLRIAHNIELLLAVVYGFSAVLVQSNFIWSWCVIVLGIWFGSWTSYRSGTYCLDLNYPLRFVLFGAGLIAVSGLMRDQPITSTLSSTARIWGMLYLFVALWMLSLFGNDTLREDNVGAHGGLRRMAFWSAAFLCAAAIAIWHGLQHDDSTAKGFGLAFLGINLYTKFFEFCWSMWYKSVFFAILACSLALLGIYAEPINITLHEGYHSLSV
ncbi:hypothetical protein F4680DRAFT_407606 [Xylaria scruposa]|nr:hypothetical protein F4680DRAFT_407606 [Xylaria scruposa]